MMSSMQLLDSLIISFSNTINQIKVNRQQNLNSKEHLLYIDKFDVEYWYSLISHLTFKTKFISITPDDAKTFISIYQQKVQLEESINDNNGTIINNWLQNQIDENLKTLNSKIQNELINWNDDDIKRNEEELHFFCKLSSRSPKDAIINHWFYDKTKKLYLKYLENNIYDKTNKYSLNDKKIALNQAMIDILKSKNSNEILMLFLHSKRIYDDLQIALNKEIWQQNIIIREWNNINVMYEFRGFVYDNKLNAISQYQYSEKLQFLIQNKSKIETLIKSFWEKQCKYLLNHIYDDYIIDFILIDSNPNNKDKYIENWNVKVIELNPYSDDTGALLFSWNFDRDILQNGPFEIRLQSLQFGQGDIRKLYPIHKRLLLS